VKFAPSNGGSFGFVDLHYSLNGGGQYNVRMNVQSDKSWTYTIANSKAGDAVAYNFTYQVGNLASDSPSFSYSIAGGSTPVVTPTPSASPTPVATATPTPAPTATPAATPTPVASATPVPTPSAGSPYKLVEDFSGANFFDHFTFNTFPDPTLGYVNYVDKATAQSKGLIAYDAAKDLVRISVESSTIPAGGTDMRKSVRISSNTVFNSGLFIIDVAHMPEGVSTWPAFWTFGPDWPNNGEIDIIEGVNNNNRNMSTLHSKAGCNMNPVNSIQTMLGEYTGSRDCNDNGGKNGCPTTGPADSFGPNFNNNGGGVYATLWNSAGVKVWFFPRTKIPVDLAAGNPDPSKWGLPTSNFEFGNNCTANNYVNHNVIVNTTLCGEWAGPTFNGPYSSGWAACNEFVQNNPSAFSKAYWEIRYIRAFAPNN
jgi:hypothetical protein